MAAKKTRKPAIEKPEGIIDDVLNYGLRVAGRKIAKSSKKAGVQKVAQKAFDKAYRHEIATITGMKARKLKGYPERQSSKNALKHYEQLEKKQSVAMAKRKNSGYVASAKKVDKIAKQRRKTKGWAITEMDDYLAAERMLPPSSKRGNIILAQRKAARRNAVKRVVRKGTR
jgi:hypothetical protein